MQRILKILVIFIMVTSFKNLYASSKIIDLVSVSSSYNEKSIQIITKVLKSRGFKVRNKYLNQYQSDLGYVNLDKVRADTLIEALKDPDSSTLFFVKGGGGSINLIPYLYKNLEDLKKLPPKTIIGFSDVTAIHIFVNQELGWKSIHGIVAAYNKEVYEEKKGITETTIPEKADLGYLINSDSSLSNIIDILDCKPLSYNYVLPLNKAAENALEINSTLVGGNLTLVQSLIATPYELNFTKKTLILEDVGASYRNLDRSLHQLIYTGKINNADAVIFGQFFAIDALEPDKLIYKQTMKNFADKVDVPVFYWPFFGHGLINNPLILNGSIKLTKNDVFFTLEQPSLCNIK